MTWPRWLRRAVRNRHRHAIEQASRRWREGRRDDSGRTRREILISTQVIPLALDWAGLDAATVAPPAVTTLIDALGIVIYLTVARAVLDVSPAPHADQAAEVVAAAAAAAASNVVENVVKAAAEGVGSEL